MGYQATVNFQPCVCCVSWKNPNWEASVFGTCHEEYLGKSTSGRNLEQVVSLFRLPRSRDQWNPVCHSNNCTWQGYTRWNGEWTTAIFVSSMGQLWRSYISSVKERSSTFINSVNASGLPTFIASTVIGAGKFVVPDDKSWFQINNMLHSSRFCH